MIKLRLDHPSDFFDERGSVIKIEMEVLPHALAEIVPGITIGNTTGETVKVTVELNKIPVHFTAGQWTKDPSEQAADQAPATEQLSEEGK